MSEKLSSEVLERQFGETELEILLQNADIRLIATTTKVPGPKVLELSWVTFDQDVAGSFPEVNQEMADGRSMGKAFDDSGTPIRREARGVYACGGAELPAVFARRFGEQGPMTVVDVAILAGPEGKHYADILEVYSPSVDWPEAGEVPDQVVIDRLEAFGQLLEQPDAQPH